ncbi:hypothetical protein UlMin_032911 [Ulmus minor]
MEFVTGVASSVVEKILEYPVRFMGRHLGYLIYYQTNKKNLIDRVPELNDKISSIQRRAHAARRNGEQLEECVTGWISEAERKIQEANEVINDRGHENAKCSCNGSFPNLLSRYKLSKKAKIMADNILIDLQKTDNFGNFSCRPLIQPSFKNKDYEAFDTRLQTSKEIMEALRDPNLTMIGVYGMGGIGKTTLVNEVARQAKEEECFSELVVVTVSQDCDLKNIQNGIAEGLGLTLDGENMSVRANRLQHRLRQGDKILIILDDIWSELDLSKAGIYFNADDQRGCKILLVSRDQEVLYSGMRVRKNIEVKVLSNSESMSLFYKYVGDKADNPDFKTLANQVVGECGGLPIAIATIACSLENKSLLVWKDTLHQLKRSPKRGVYGKVYSCIKTSYDFLESEEEKKLLLLCSLHGEDANVPVNYLMIYGIGWDLFQEVVTMEEARCRVHSLVHKLKACCLLLNGDVEGFVKMHDVIRDVMISVAKEDEHMHCLTKVAELEECLHKENFRESSKAIMLLGPDFNNQLLPRLVCPKLQLLLAFNRYRWLSLGSIPDDFFKEAQELKALSFNCYPLQSLPQSFCTLRHLRALRLRLGRNEDLTLIGELRNLIALDLSWSTFSQLPEHIGKLTRLRSLNLSYCGSLRVIQPNVISSLVQLEELYMDKVNIDWEVEGRVGEGRNASLMEINNLRHLTTLHLNVRDANVLPKDMFSENLQRYRIMIGSFKGYTRGFTGSRLLYLNLRESSQLYQYGIQRLMKKSEGMLLEEFHGVDNIVYELDGFPQLKNFCLQNNDEVQYIVSSTEEIQTFSAFQSLETLNLENLRNLEKICYGNVTMESFGKLRRIDVRNCDKLKNLFSFSIARKLEKINVSECKMMEMLIYLGSEDATHGNINNEAISEKLEFPRLRSLNLNSLSNLIFFWSGLETTCGSSLSDSPQPLFGEKVLFPSLKKLELSGMNFRELWSPISCMQNLSSLAVSSCPNLKYLFTVAMAGKLPQLETLKICGCPVMEEVVVTNEHGEGRLEKILFPKLNSLKLDDLPNLKRFCPGDCIECPTLLKLRIKNCGVLRMFISSNEEEVEGPFFNEKVVFPSLKELKLSGMNFRELWLPISCLQNLSSLDVSSCPNLKYLFTVAMAGKLPQLETLKIRGCPVMEEVVVTNEHGEGRLEKILFPKLNTFELEDLPNLKRFCTGNCIEFPSLLQLRIKNCGVPRMFISSNEEEVEGPFFNEKVAFSKLEALFVSDLNSVNYLFSFAVAKSLVTLKKLEVLRCSLMEEIVQVNEQGEEGRLDKISFPKLERIHFEGLSNLKRFYGGACIEFPSLLKLGGQHLVFNEVFCPKLEELTTTSSVLIKKMCNCQSSRAPPFCNLKAVDLKCFHDEPIGFSLKWIQRYQNLESLSLSGFIMNTTHHHQQIMVSLEEHERPLKRLKKLRLFQLSMLTHLYEDSEDSENSSLESLKFLLIRECNRLKSPLLSSTASFQNLMALVVSKCFAMIYLLASSTAKTLVHLRLMSITECKQMTEIIVDEIVDDEIVFGKLEILELSDLPSLRSFHSAGNSVMRFPNLVNLLVSQCPEMQRFSFGMIDAPKLDSILEVKMKNDRWDYFLDESNIEDLWLPEPQRKFWEGDINKTLEKLWEEDNSLVMQQLFTET